VFLQLPSSSPNSSSSPSAWLSETNSPGRSKVQFTVMGLQLHNVAVRLDNSPSFFVGLGVGKRMFKKIIFWLTCSAFFVFFNSIIKVRGLAVTCTSTFATERNLLSC